MNTYQIFSVGIFLRRVPLNKHTRAILNRCLERSKNRPTIFRFKIDDVEKVSKEFKAYARKAGLEKHRFHDLRHTVGSHMAMMDKGDTTIQELMRHKSPKSTKVYTKLSPKHLQEASEDLNYGPMPVAKKDD
uniref:Tyrosine-type recombinase/integrase n=1 Tax=Candidatus Desulfatibia profunda TaxID=2841695 RepID=A0A8J6THX6_9BACT|nr:tyrosine-type recombinase/integrase [Candidatus Desulfatibia profunda]